MSCSVDPRSDTIDEKSSYFLGVIGVFVPKTGGLYTYAEAFIFES